MPRDGLQKRLHQAAAIATLTFGGLVASSGCASTEYFNEGPGQPSDRASGAVPFGALGVCKLPRSRRPPIVGERLWEDARTCTGKTPPSFIRLGYGSTELAPGGPADAEATQADSEVAKIVTTLQASTQDEGGNAVFTQMMRQIRDRSIKHPELRSRVSKETARTSVCDFTYLLNVMVKERARLEDGSTCSVEVYNQKARTEECLFDTSRPDAVWLSSAWDCVAQTNELGDEQSCHRLCAYDDYCTRQVSCAAADLDLLLCVLGVCLPEQRVGF